MTNLALKSLPVAPRLPQASTVALVRGAELVRFEPPPRQRIHPANDNELVIDLFAGGGGTSEGIKAAIGRDPDIAANHSRAACAMHALNHPNSMHLCEDIKKVDVEDLLQRHFPGRRVGILWASPDCKHFSKAGGGKLKDRKIRGLAWEVLRWAAAIKRATGYLPSLIALENVEEFQEWCPLHRYGAKAGRIQRRKKGRTFQRWVEALRRIGFVRIEWRELVAADYGVPTTRKRFFLVAMSEVYDADWPEATHGPRSRLVAQADLFATESQLEPYRSAAEIIDWSIPLTSIFGRKRPLKSKTLERIAKGVKRWMVDAAEPLVVTVTHTKSDRAARTAAEPLGTLTTAKGGEFALAVPTLLPVNHGGGEGRVYDPRDPARTITAAPRGEQALAAAYLGRQFGTTISGRDLRAPHPAVMSDGGGGKSQLVAARLAPIIDKYYGSGVAADAAEPLDTATAIARFGLAGAYLETLDQGPAQVDGQLADIVQIGALLSERFSADDGAASLTREHLWQSLGHDRHSKRRAVLEFLWSHFGAPSAAEWADPAATASGRLRFGLVDVAGVLHLIADIGMRMLEPRELFSAQGFRADYIIDLVHEGRRLTKAQQTSMAGNSVPPKMAEVIIKSFMPPSMRRQPERMAA